MTKCITMVGQVKKWRYWQPAIYEARPRQLDGIETWRFVEYIGTPTRSFEKAVDEAREYAYQNHILYLADIRHGRVYRLQGDRL